MDRYRSIKFAWVLALAFFCQGVLHATPCSNHSDCCASNTYCEVFKSECKPCGVWMDESSCETFPSDPNSCVWTGSSCILNPSLCVVIPELPSSKSWILYVSLTFFAATGFQFARKKKSLRS